MPLTEAQIDAIIEAEDRKWEQREAFEEAHRLASETRTEGDDYRTTFGASLTETRKRRAAKARHREWLAWNRFQWGIGPDPRNQ